ncbi:hypothetical protein [Nostoc sp. T09]|uniref:hypothetical protein n=1 Tax=Nostoc sp. T09 TaxID=1932621 RepID=UPI00117D2CB2|nr:hypothetical protein [Nostoc sp. T09]
MYFINEWVFYHDLVRRSQHSQNGTKLEWLIFLDEASILIIFPNQGVKILTDIGSLHILNNIDLSLNIEQVFSWLNL